MKIAITGSTGRLGGALVRHFESQGFEVLPLPRAQYDLSDPSGLKKAISQESFDILINPAATTNVDLCETETETARLTNEEAPKILAEYCRDSGAKMIHISTDYVFDGKTEGLKNEDDTALPLGAYGESKLAGEKAVLSVSEDFYVLRTSWVFGPDRPSFIDWIINEAKVGNELKAVEDKFSSPSYTEDFAHYLEVFISKNSPGGIYHLCNSGTCSWHSFGQEALNYLNEKSYPLKETSIESISVTDIPQFVAQRPIHTALATDKISSILREPPRTWQSALHSYLDQSYLNKLASSQ